MSADRINGAVRAVIVGLGVHGRGIARLGAEAGITFVAAVDPFQAGKDVGALVEAPALAGLSVAASVDELDWPGMGADIAIVAAKAPVPQIVELMKELLDHGVDVVTIVEDAYDLQLIDPALHEILDRAARQAGKTAVATGTQDIAWVGLVMSATGLVRELESIDLKQHLGVDGYPEEFVRWAGIGVTVEDWEAAAQVANQTPSVFGGVLPTMARALGLTPGQQRRQMEVFSVDYDLKSETFGRMIPAGEPAGRKDLVVLETEEGVRLSAELVTSAVMGQDDFTAAIQGQTRVELEHRLLPASPTVDATVINRVPDVLAAPAGLIATPELPPARYRHHIDAPQVQALA